MLLKPKKKKKIKNSALQKQEQEQQQQNQTNFLKWHFWKLNWHYQKKLRPVKIGMSLLNWSLTISTCLQCAFVVAFWLKNRTRFLARLTSNNDQITRGPTGLALLIQKYISKKNRFHWLQWRQSKSTTRSCKEYIFTMRLPHSNYL